MNNILIKGDGVRFEFPLKASNDVTPGMLLARSGIYCIPHDVAGGEARPSLFALENPYVDTVSGVKSIDTDYDTDLEVVFAVAAERGAKIYAWLADGQTTLVNSLLESDGAGSLQLLNSAQGSGVQAVLFVDGVDENGGLTFTAVQAGEAGNAIKIVVVDAAGSAALTVVGNLITVTPITSGNTAADVVDQIEANAAASALVTVVAEGTGAGEPGVDTGSFLAGGVNAQAIARALEVVAASGAIARVEVEVL